MLIDEALARVRETLNGMMIPGSEAEKMAATKDTVDKVIAVIRANRKAQEAKETENAENCDE